MMMIKSTLFIIPVRCIGISDICGQFLKSRNVYDASNFWFIKSENLDALLQDYVSAGINSGS